MTATTSPSRLGDIASLVRLRQWIKNVLVFVAPGAAGLLWHRNVLEHSIASFVGFCGISSFIYVMNDLRDAPLDRQHPTKQFRAIANGRISRPVAWVVALLMLALGIAAPLASHVAAGFYVVLAVYVVEALGYVALVKNIPVVEMMFLASGFLLRGCAGAAASHIPVSEWFLVVIGSGALLIVSSKRLAELLGSGATTRKVLAEYTPEFLRSAVTLSATVVVTAYCLWAFTTTKMGLSNASHHLLPIRLSTIPVVTAVLFLLQASSSSSSEAPENLLLRNRVIQVLVLTWLVLIGLGIA